MPKPSLDDAIQPRTRITHLELTNWRNFQKVAIDLRDRVFIVGPNASGKSNLLDAIRFLRDLAEPKGGFQAAVEDRREGVSKIRSLHARKNPNVVVGVKMSIDGVAWRYRLEFSQDNNRRPVVKSENAWRDGDEVLARPDDADRKDGDLLYETSLEHSRANIRFRPVCEFLGEIRYLHVVPQLVREPERSVGKSRDPFGGDFLEQIATFEKANRRVFVARMKRIRDALKVAVPQLKDLEISRDHKGVPHLRGLFEHWRPEAGWQSESQLSDGTLRLIGLLWALLDGNAPLLLEEPELSLHSGIVRLIPALIERLGEKTRRQVLISTHSEPLLSDKSIGMEEVLLLQPTDEGTLILPASKSAEINELLRGGIPLSEIVLPLVAPKHVQQLLFDAEEKPTP